MTNVLIKMIITLRLLIPLTAIYLSSCALPMPTMAPPHTPTQVELPTEPIAPTHMPTLIPTQVPSPVKTNTPTQMPTPTTTAVPTPLGQTGHWRLVFADDFANQVLDETKWTTCWSYGCATTRPSVWYSATNVIVGNGFVRLRADNHPQNHDGRIIPFTSGMLSTGAGRDGSPPRFTAQYGYFEARVKVPSGRGLWPAFWMLTPEQGPPEIDIMEVLSKEPTRVHLHYHYIDGSGVLQDYGNAWDNGDFSASWHTFGVDWQPGAIVWYVDGVERNRYEGDYVAAESLYLILNLQVGGTDSWSGPTDATTVFPAYYDIDYVRVWQRAVP